MNQPVIIRTRSPRFPSTPLEDAIVYAKRIYDAVHRSQVEADTAFRLMGFAGKSGASSSALGALRQYGLIEGIAEKTRISDLSLEILEPASRQEYANAVFEASQKPEVFARILQRFDGKIPIVDEPIRAYLIREVGFSKTGVDECVSALRRTLSFTAELSSDRQVVDQNVSIAPTLSKSEAQALETISNHEVVLGDVTRYRLTKDCMAEVRFQGSPDIKALSMLIRNIELMREALED